MAEIDELKIVISAEIDKFVEGMKQTRTTADTESKKIGSAFSRLNTGVQNVSKQFFNLKNAIIGLGIQQLVTRSIESADAIAKLSTNTGIGTDAIQALSFAAANSGVKQEELNQALFKFNGVIGSAVNGSLEAADNFRKLGINLFESNGALKNTETLMREVSDKVSTMGNAAERTRVLMDLFGRSGAKLTALFEGGSAQLDKFQKQAASLGLIIDKKLLMNAEKLNDEMEVMGMVLKTQVMTAVIQLGPQIQTLTKFIIDMTLKVAEAAKGVATGFDLIRASMGDGSATTAGQVAGLTIKLGALREELFKLMNEDPAEHMIIYGQAAADNTKKMEALRAEIAKTSEELAALQKTQEKETKAKEEGRGPASSGGVTDDMVDKQEEINDMRAEQAEQEILELEEKNALLKEVDAKLYAEQIAANDAKIKKIQEQEQKNYLFNAKMRKKEMDEEKLKRDTLVQGTMDLGNNLMTISKGHSKSMFEIGKALAIASTTIHGIDTVQATLKNPPGPPFTIPAAVAQGLAAATRVAQIKGTSFATGIDYLPGTGSADSIPAMLQPGEAVVKRAQNVRLQKYLDAQMPAGSPDNVAQANMAGSGAGGNIRIDLVMRGDFMDMIETQLVERGQLGVSLIRG